MDISVSVKHLTKKYKLYEDKWGPIKELVSRKKMHKEFLALKDVSLNFPKGEAIGVLGKNGSGKSTLLKIITGIADPTSGTVDVNGSLVFLDVSSGIDPELSGYENIFMKGTLLGYSKQDMLSKVDDIIEFSELKDFINQPVKNYSSGMKAKLGFAISVNVNPDILIVDEALAVGDSMFREKCMNKMNEFKEQGKTIIFVSHDNNAVESFCSKAAWIHQGELITYGDSKLIGSMYNDFMSGRKRLDMIRSELQFNHSIENVSQYIKDQALTIELEGYLYDRNNNYTGPFELVIRNDRTGEVIVKALSRKMYSGNASLSDEIKETAGLSITLSETEFPSFFRPGKFTFSVRFKNERNEWNEFSIWARDAEINTEDFSSYNNSPFKYNLLILQNKLVLEIDNHDKVQQQTNNIWFEDNLLNIEGVAFVRGYESESADNVAIDLHLVNMETHEEKIYPTVISETEEITENISFNPKGKNYNYSQFKAVIDVNDLKKGKYEFILTYQMKKEPFHRLIVLVWASKNEAYPIGTHIIQNREIEIQTEKKYLQMTVNTL